MRPETSACYSDLYGQAFALWPPVGALPQAAPILPPVRGLMNARCLARGIRFICRRGQESCRLRLSSPPGMCLSQWLLTAHSLSRLPPQHRCLRASLVEVPLLSTSTNDRFGFRVERLFLPARLCLPDTAPASRCRSLQLHLHSQTLFDGSASLRCQPETSACFSDPSMTGCFTPSCISHGSHTDGHIPSTYRGRSRQHSTPSAVFYYSSATLTR